MESAGGVAESSEQQPATASENKCAYVGTRTLLACGEPCVGGGNICSQHNSVLELLSRTSAAELRINEQNINYFDENGQRVLRAKPYDIPEEHDSDDEMLSSSDTWLRSYRTIENSQFLKRLPLSGAGVLSQKEQLRVYVEQKRNVIDGLKRLRRKNKQCLFDDLATFHDDGKRVHRTDSHAWNTYLKLRSRLGRRDDELFTLRKIITDHRKGLKGNAQHAQCSFLDPSSEEKCTNRSLPDCGRCFAHVLSTDGQHLFGKCSVCSAPALPFNAEILCAAHRDVKWSSSVPAAVPTKFWDRTEPLTHRELGYATVNGPAAARKSEDGGPSGSESEDDEESENGSTLAAAEIAPSESRQSSQSSSRPSSRPQKTPRPPRSEPPPQSCARTRPFMLEHFNNPQKDRSNANARGQLPHAEPGETVVHGKQLQMRQPAYYGSHLPIPPMVRHQINPMIPFDRSNTLSAPGSRPRPSSTAVFSTNRVLPRVPPPSRAQPSTGAVPRISTDHVILQRSATAVVPPRTPLPPTPRPVSQAVAPQQQPLLSSALRTPQISLSMMTALMDPSKASSSDSNRGEHNASSGAAGTSADGSSSSPTKRPRAEKDARQLPTPVVPSAASKPPVIGRGVQMSDRYMDMMKSFEQKDNPPPPPPPSQATTLPPQGGIYAARTQQANRASAGNRQESTTNSSQDQCHTSPPGEGGPQPSESAATAVAESSSDETARTRKPPRVRPEKPSEEQKAMEVAMVQRIIREVSESFKKEETAPPPPTQSSSSVKDDGEKSADGDAASTRSNKKRSRTRKESEGSGKASTSKAKVSAKGKADESTTGTREGDAADDPLSMLANVASSDAAQHQSTEPEDEEPEEEL